jgi:hypothetical protein
MTQQLPEIIFLDGAPYCLESRPLEPFLDTMETRPNFKSLANVWSTCLSRGYVGHWEIRDYKLFLTRLGTCEDELAFALEAPNGFLMTRRPGEEKDSIDLRHIFPDREPPVFASWYSGTLSVPLGDQLLYMHLGLWNFCHQGEHIIHVRHGHVVKERCVDHTARFLDMLERSPYLFSEDGIIEGPGPIPHPDWLTDEGRVLAERHMKRQLPARRWD